MSGDKTSPNLDHETQFVNAERLKQIAIGYRDPLYTLALILGCICLLAITTVVVIGAWYAIPAIKEWHHASAATREMYETGLGTVKAAADNVKAATAEIAPTLKGLQADEVALKDFIDAKNKESSSLLTGLETRLERLDGLIVSVQGVSDETRVQIKQNGDAVHAGLVSLDMMIKNTDTRVSKLIEDGSLMIETLNPRLAAMLEHTDALIVDADGTIKAYQPLGERLTGIATNGEAMSADVRRKLNEVLFPPKVKGFWPNVKRIATFMYQPAFDGIRIYYTLRSLPVRVTQPIPLPKP